MTVKALSDSDGTLPDGIYDFELPNNLLPNFSNEAEQPAQTASGFAATGTRVLLVLLVLLSTVLLLMVLNMCRRHYRTASDLRERVPEPAIDPRRIERRYETIEGWLITKKAKKHDVMCEKLVVASAQRKDAASSVEICTQIRCSSSHDTAETCDEWSFNDYEEKECPICMEGLELNDAVSWSPNEKCSHVFHHECIKEWLLKHVECPLCRTIFLLVDRDDIEKDCGSLQKLSDIHAHRTATSYFCLHDGLVNVPGKIDCTEKDFELIRKRVSLCINRTHLAKIRGDRQEGTIRTSNKVESTIEHSGQVQHHNNDENISVVLPTVAGDQSDSTVDEELAEVTDR